MAKKDQYLEDRKLIMHQFCQHTKAIGGLTQEVRGLSDKMIAIQTINKVEMKAENKKDNTKTRYLAVIISAVLSAAIALTL